MVSVALIFCFQFVFAVYKVDRLPKPESTHRVGPRACFTEWCAQVDPKEIQGLLCLMDLAFWLSLLAGSAIFLGALVASHEHIRPFWLEEEFHHSVTALGGGALLAAIALVLIPEGIKNQSLLSVIVTFTAGGVLAMMMDRYFASRKSSASQLAAMLLDFVPESIIIGAVITKNTREALLLAVIIFVQNLPESFNAYRDMRKHNGMPHHIMLILFFCIAFSGPAYVYLGAAVLVDYHTLLAMLMTFCAGGILYLVFNDIAPQVKLKHH
jgi:ZIP family zinc transporter